MKTVKRIQPILSGKNVKQRVAAYARVSDSRLHHSLSTQISYYNRLIQAHPDWELAGVYYDEGVSGKHQDNRQGFQNLLHACEKREIDRILTKSIARFGRNTVELLSTVRQLRDIGVGVSFEKEGIDSLSSEGELMLTLLASVAQEESLNISQNIRWKVRKKFEQGLPYTPQDMYGYRWQGDHYIIEPLEAQVIREVFKWYLDGASIPQIATKLNHKGILTRLGNPFTVSSIREFFKQDAYYGSLVLQKTYREDFSRNPKRNQGQRDKFIVEDAHEAIVSKDYFDRIIAEKEKRYQENFKESHLQKGFLRDKIFCSHCGKKMIVRVDNKKVHQTVRYCCRTRDRCGKNSCISKTLSEKRLIATFQTYLDFEPTKEWFRQNVKEVCLDSNLEQLKVIPTRGRSYILDVRKERFL